VYDEDDLLPVSALQDIMFCERRCALRHIERHWEENVATVEGQNFHERSHDSGTESRVAAAVAAVGPVG
jgi:CRISPR-associated exonuclease Cas4